MKLGSLFDGSGGFPLAGFLCDIEPVWASEIEPYPIAVTKSRFPYVKHLGDISKINGAEIEPVDIITFGSPCQDLSVAGKRAGLKHENNGDDETTRSGLFMEAVRIIKEMRRATNGKYPRWICWENVPGAFSSNKGEDFKIVLEEIIKIVEPTAVMPEVPRFGWAYADSYVGNGWSLAYRVFDAQYWGVPQRRRRIYLVADFGGECARKILFEREGLRGYFAESGTPWQTTPADAERSIGTDDKKREIPYTLKIRSGCEGGGKGALIQENMSATLACNNDQYLFQPTAYGISAYESNSMKSSNPHSGIYKADTSRTLDLNGGNPACNQGGIAIVEPIAVATQQGGAEIAENGICPTITAAAGMSGNNQPWICKVADSNILDDQGGSQISVRHDGKAPTLRAEMHGNVPCVMEAAGFCPEQSAKTRGIGYEEENSPTLRAGVTPAIICKTWDARGNGDGRTANTITGDHENRITDYTSVVVSKETVALEGNGQRPSHRGDGYLVTDKSYTLNTTEVHGVAYAIDQQGGKGGANYAENVMPTLCSDSHGTPHGVVYAVDQGGGKSQANVSEEMSPTLTCTHSGEPAVAYSFDPGASRDVGVLFIEECAKTLTNGTCPGHHDGVVLATNPIAIDRATFNQGENALYNPQINEDGTTSTLVAKGPSAVCYSIDEKCANTYVWEDQANTLAARDYKQPQAVCYEEDPKPVYIVRRLTPTECARLQGFADRWGDIDKKTKFSDEEYHFWHDVRNTHAAINGRAVKEYNKKQMLTWYNKLHTDSAEYKMWGNGIALPTALYVMQGIKEASNENY